MSTLEERLQGGSSMPWIPDPAKAAKYENPSYNEQVVIGIAVDHFTRENYMGDGFYDVVVINVEGVGDVAIHCQATVLASQMHAARPKPGERVGVAYKGERAGGKGPSGTYSDYTVKVERELGGDFAWADGGVDESYQEPQPEPTPPEPTFPSQQETAPAAPVLDDIPFAYTVF